MLESRASCANKDRGSDERDPSARKKKLVALQHKLLLASRDSKGSLYNAGCQVRDLFFHIWQSIIFFVGKICTDHKTTHSSNLIGDRWAITTEKEKKTCREFFLCRGVVSKQASSPEKLKRRKKRPDKTRDELSNHISLSLSSGGGGAFQSL